MVDSVSGIASTSSLSSIAQQPPERIEARTPIRESTGRSDQPSAMPGVPRNGSTQAILKSRNRGGAVVVDQTTQHQLFQWAQAWQGAAQAYGPAMGSLFDLSKGVTQNGAREVEDIRGVGG